MCSPRGCCRRGARVGLCVERARVCGTVEGPCVRFALTLCARVRAWSVVSGQQILGRGNFFPPKLHQTVGAALARPEHVAVGAGLFAVNYEVK